MRETPVKDAIKLDTWKDRSLACIQQPHATTIYSIGKVGTWKLVGEHQPTTIIGITVRHRVWGLV